jgi:hypothetical protein
MDFYKLVILISLTLLLLFMYYESEHVVYHAQCLFSNKNKTGLPTPLLIRKQVISLIETLPRNLTLIDFGCGDGDFISHCHPYVNKTIGIELDLIQANQTKAKFMHHKSIQIIGMDILDYPFESKNSILYMYEPLWTLSKDNAKEIYTKVMHKQNLSRYIIYVSGIQPILDESFFLERSYKTIHHSRANRMLGWNANHIYLFSLKT